MVSERKKRNIYNETLRRAQSGDDSSYVRGQLKSMGLNMRTAQDAPRRKSATPQWQKNLGKEVRKFGSTAGTMASDAPKFVEKYLPGLSGLAQRMISGGTRGWDEAQTARRDDKKWTLGGDELDISKGTPAYKWLLDNIIQPEYEDDFRKEVGKDNLHWTELNKYAGDKSAGLAPRINLLNDPTRFEDYNPVQQENYLGSILDPDWENVSTGIEDTAAGRRALNEYINAGSVMKGQGMVGNAGAETAYPFLARSTGVAPNAYYGDRDVLLDMNVPYEDKYVEQFDIAEALSPSQKYLLQSQVQGRGGYDYDPSGAFKNAGFDPNYLGEDVRMRINNPTLEEEEEEQGIPFFQ